MNVFPGLNARDKFLTLRPVILEEVRCLQEAGLTRRWPSEQWTPAFNTTRQTTINSGGE